MRQTISLFIVSVSYQYLAKKSPDLSLNATIPWCCLTGCSAAEVLAQLRPLVLVEWWWWWWYSRVVGVQYSRTNGGGLRACASHRPPSAGLDTHFR